MQDTQRETLGSVYLTSIYRRDTLSRDCPAGLGRDRGGSLEPPCPGVPPSLMLEANVVNDDYLEQRLRTAYFPGLGLFGRAWLDEAKKRTEVPVFLVERHHSVRTADSLQRELGRHALVIALNNPIRAEEGCPKCPRNWHRELEKQAGLKVEVETGYGVHLVR